MSNFDSYLEGITQKGSPIVHGLVASCVDKKGNEIHSKVVGYKSLSPDAEPLRKDAVFRIADCTKFITSIALLQCIERGLIGMDESVFKILPELEELNIISWSGEESKQLQFQKRTRQVTPRQLLTHSSGIAYDMYSPVLLAWRSSRGEKFGEILSRSVPEAFSSPLVFEPGLGWAFGASIDWAGTLVERLNGNIPLQEYFLNNIWIPIGLEEPYPAYNLAEHPEYESRLLEPGLRTPEGRLKETVLQYGGLIVREPRKVHGGCGLSSTISDFTAVMADLISEDPKLLTRETVTDMFTPQFQDNSPSLEALRASSRIWGSTTGPVRSEGINHGLGGVLLTEEVPELGQPKNTLTWGGAWNLVWFMNRDRGVAGIFATQITPPDDTYCSKVINEWKKDFWSTLS